MNGCGNVGTKCKGEAEKRKKRIQIEGDNGNK